MQKRITTTLFLIVLTLTLTQLATAQWIDNAFTNDTSGDLYVAFTTFRPAKGAIPQGWRTVGWYPIRAGASHTFQAWDENPIYYLIWEEDTDSYLTTPDRANRYTHWESLKAFVLVSEDETDVNVSAAGLLYSNRDRETLQRNRDFFRADNGTSITVNDDGVFLGDTVDRPGGDDDTETDVSIRITSGSGTTLNQGSTSQLTISVTENGNPAANKTLSLSVNSSKATISPTFGTTNSSGQLSATLAIDRSATLGTFNVSASIANTDHSATLPITVEIGVGQLAFSSSGFTTEPGRHSTLTITAKTWNDVPFPNAQISLSATSGTLNPTLVTTDAQGQAKATFFYPSVGTPRVGTVSTSEVTATVIGNDALKASTTIKVGYSVGSVSASAVVIFTNNVPDPISIDDVFGSRTLTVLVGARMNITVLVGSSASKTPLPGVSVSISESSSRMWFKPSSGTTNSSGQWRTTMHTRDDGGEPPERPEHFFVVVENRRKRSMHILVGDAPGAPSLPSQAYEQDLSLVAVHPQMQLPSETALLPNYPNPFNPETWIPYHLAESADVTLDIYSADGKLVRTLALGHQSAGIYENKSRAAYWDGKNTIGERVASGIYFYMLTANDFTATGKMLILK